MTLPTDSQPKASSMYQHLIDVLREFHVFSAADVAGLRLVADMASAYVTAGDYPWAQHVFDTVKSWFPKILESFESGLTPRIVSDRIFKMGRPVSPLDPVFDQRAVYGCLFPRRVWFASHQFVSRDGAAFVPPDFLTSLLTLAPLLTSGLAVLLPIRFKEYEESDIYARETLGTFNYRRNNPELVTISHQGFGIDELSAVTAQEQPLKNGISLAALPYLIGCRVEDYVDLVQENPDEFELYCTSLSKFIGERSDASLALEWARQVQDASLRLGLALKGKERELNRKKIEVVAGMFCTVASLMIPDLRPALTGIVGAKSIVDGISWIVSYRDRSATLRSDPFWIIWEAGKGSRTGG